MSARELSAQLVLEADVRPQVRLLDEATVELVEQRAWTRWPVPA